MPVDWPSAPRDHDPWRPVGLLARRLVVLWTRTRSDMDPGVLFCRMGLIKLLCCIACFVISNPLKDKL